jgi:hypothetical protein
MPDIISRETEFLQCASRFFLSLILPSAVLHSVRLLLAKGILITPRKCKLRARERGNENRVFFVSCCGLLLNYYKNFTPSVFNLARRFKSQHVENEQRNINSSLNRILRVCVLHLGHPLVVHSFSYSCREH